MGVPWLLLANAFNRAVTIGTQLLVGFLLVPEQVGTFAVAAGMAGMLSPFQSGDHARLALQDPEDPARAAAALRTWLFAGCLLSCALAIGVVPWLGIEVALAPLACLAVLSPLRVMSNLRVALLSREKRTPAIAGAGACEGLARSLALIGTALLGAGAWSLVFGEAAAALVSLALLARLHPGPGAAVGFRLPPGMARRLGATLGVCLLVGVELNCSAVAIGHLCSADAAGSFAFANRIASQLTVLLLPLVTVETLPRLLAAVPGGIAFRSASRSELRRLLPVIAAFAGLLAIAGPPAMVAVWGERWSEAAAMLRWLALSVGLRLAYAVAKIHLEALGSFSRIFALSVLDTGLILVAILAAGWTGDALAMVRALAGESAVILAVAALVVRRRLPPA